MLSISMLWEKQAAIENETTKTHNEDLKLCQSAISLLFDAFASNIELSSGKEDDYRLIIWGYLGTTINSSTWCLNAACNGQYRIAMILVRVLVEEVITSKYFLKHQEMASDVFKQAAQNSTTRIRFDQNIKRKFKDVGISPNNSLYKFYDQISDRFSHANSTELPLYIDSNQGTVAVQEPEYNSEKFQAIVVNILQLMQIMIVTVWETFNEFQDNSPNWTKQAKAVLDRIIERRNKK
jgi:hypothetical protein